MLMSMVAMALCTVSVSTVAAVAVAVVRGWVVVGMVGWCSRIWSGSRRQGDGAAVIAKTISTFAAEMCFYASADDAGFASSEVLEEWFRELPHIWCLVRIRNDSVHNGTMGIRIDVIGMGERVVHVTHLIEAEV